MPVANTSIEDVGKQLIPLSRYEKKYLISKAKDTISSLIDHAHTLRGPVQWHYNGKFHGIQMYRGEGESKTSDRIEFLCGVTTMQGHLSEVSAYFDQSTTARMRQKMPDDMIDCRVLYDLVHGVQGNEFQRIAVKYAAYEGPSALSRGRDYCFLECQDTFYHSSGRRGWALSMHSIRLPTCPEIEGIVRGSMYHSGYVFVESEREGYMDVLHSLQINFKGSNRLPYFLLNATLKRRISSVVDVSREIQTLRSGNRPLVRRKNLVPKNMRAFCSCCSRKFWLLMPKVRCRMCGEVVCRPCAPLMDYDIPGYRRSRVRVCTACTKREQTRASRSQDQRSASNMNFLTNSLVLDDDNGTDYEDEPNHADDYYPTNHYEDDAEADERAREDGLEIQTATSTFSQELFTNSSKHVEPLKMREPMAEISIDQESYRDSSYGHSYTDGSQSRIGSAIDFSADSENSRTSFGSQLNFFDSSYVSKDTDEDLDERALRYRSKSSSSSEASSHPTTPSATFAAPVIAEVVEEEKEEDGKDTLLRQNSDDSSKSRKAKDSRSNFEASIDAAHKSKDEAERRGKQESSRGSDVSSEELTSRFSDVQANVRSFGRNHIDDDLSFSISPSTTHETISDPLPAHRGIEKPSSRRRAGSEGGQVEVATAKALPSTDSVPASPFEDRTRDSEVMTSATIDKKVVQPVQEDDKESQPLSEFDPDAHRDDSTTVPVKDESPATDTPKDKKHRQGKSTSEVTASGQQELSISSRSSSMSSSNLASYHLHELSSDRSSRSRPSSRRRSSGRRPMREPESSLSRLDEESTVDRESTMSEDLVEQVRGHRELAQQDAPEEYLNSNRFLQFEDAHAKEMAEYARMAKELTGVADVTQLPRASEASSVDTRGSVNRASMQSLQIERKLARKKSSQKKRMAKLQLKIGKVQKLEEECRESMASFVSTDELAAMEGNQVDIENDSSLVRSSISSADLMQSVRSDLSTDEITEMEEELFEELTELKKLKKQIAAAKSKDKADEYKQRFKEQYQMIQDLKQRRSQWI